MKRTLLFIVMLLLAVTVAFGLSSCDDGTYTVTFTVDGEVYLTATVTSGSNVQFPENPTKEGYKFTGWELNGENISEDMIISGSVTFVATWEKDEGTDVGEHVHTLTHHNPVSATCTADGNVEYWHCALCNKCYSDANAENEITSITVSKSGHVLTHYDAKASGCTTDGNIEYWHCSSCNKNFSDSDANNEVASVTVNASHVLTHNNATEEDCTTDGCIEHWYCSVCEKSFADANAQNEVANVTVTKTGHSLSHHGAVSKDCTTNGNIEYWYCSSCEKYFSDANAENMVSTVIIPAAHTLTHHAAVDAGCTTVCASNSKNF